MKERKPNITTDPEVLDSLMSLLKQCVLEKEQKIVELRKYIANDEALIRSIKKTGRYENPRGNETNKENEAWWKRQLGEEYIP